MSADAMVLVTEPKKERRQGVADRRENAFNDPRFWVSVTSVLLTISIVVFSFLMSQISTLSGQFQAAMLQGTRHATEIEQLKKDRESDRREIESLKKTVEENEKDQRDYNFRLSNDMTEMTTLLKKEKIK